MKLSLKNYHLVANENLLETLSGKSTLENGKDIEATKRENFNGGRFLLQQDTMIIQDRKTNLEWLVGPDKDISHYEAGNWADSLGNGWRMPLKQELKELYKSGVGVESFIGESTGKSWGPFKNGGWSVWSKEINSDDSSLAWDVYFLYGYEFCYDRGTDGNIRAFAVRPRG